MKSSLKFGIWLIIVLLLIGGLLAFWHHNKLYPSTDDAYLQANVIHISPQVSGPIVQIFVDNYAVVQKGQRLLQIDPRPFQIAVSATQAQLTLALKKEKSGEVAVQLAQTQIPERQSQLRLAQANANRILALVKDGSVSKQEGDVVLNDVKVAEANLKQAYQQLNQTLAELGKTGHLNADIRAAKANLDQAELNLSYTLITAPNDGIVVNFNGRPGTMVTANTPLFDIVENNQWWVDANFKETQLARIKQGQSAIIVTDMYPNHSFTGTVYRMSPSSGAAFSLLPPENATGNWVKVTQRFPIKIIITNVNNKQYPLRVGASASVTVNTTS